VYSTLASTPFVAIGVISYAIYLWHWPIMIFARMMFGGLSAIQATACIVLSIAIATASYFVIENPIRRKIILIGSVKPYLMAFGVTAAMVAFAAIVIRAEGMPYRLPPSVQMAAAGSSDWDSSFYKCFDPPGHGSELRHALLAAAKADELCLIGKQDPAKIDFIVWGDSHVWAHLSTTIWQETTA
jgi:hypothetical protein